MRKIYKLSISVHDNLGDVRIRARVIVSITAIAEEETWIHAKCNNYSCFDDVKIRA